MSQDQLNFFYHQFNKARNFGAKNLSILIYLLIGILSLDTIINVLSAGLGITVSSSVGIILFVVSGIITIVCHSLFCNLLAEQVLRLDLELDTSD